jgi:hypothetical protein
MTTAFDPTAHARALLLDGRCPACAEFLGPRSLFGAAPCARCTTLIDPRSSGASLAASVESRGRRRLFGIVIAVAVSHLLLGWIPLVSALVLVLSAAWIRIGILQPTSALLSPRRRVLTRWTARLLVAAAIAGTVIVTEALTLLPVVGTVIKAILGAAQVGFAAWAVTAYVHWQLRREAQNRPIASWEWVLLVGAIATLIVAVITLAVAIAALGAAFERFLEGLS